MPRIYIQQVERSCWWRRTGVVINQLVYLQPPVFGFFFFALIVFCITQHQHRMLPWFRVTHHHQCQALTFSFIQKGDYYAQYILFTTYLGRFPFALLFCTTRRGSYFFPFALIIFSNLKALFCESHWPR